MDFGSILFWYRCAVPHNELLDLGGGWLDDDLTMANENQNPNSGNPNDPRPVGDPSLFSQQFQHPSLSARVPEKVARGVLSTGALVQDSPNEFVMDFVQGITRPLQIAARVVLPPSVMADFINAARENLANFEKTYGAPKELPKPPTDRRPTIEEIYSELKLSDEILSGVYANAVMIGHSASEFFFDFITRFYPNAAVSCRIYFSAQQVPRLLETLTMAFNQFQKRMAAMQQQQQQQLPPPQDPPPEEPPASS